MDKELVDSIEKFEQKKEFREVKLQIRQSFREDQDALVKRLSKYRQRKEPTMPTSNGHANEDDGDDDVNGNVNEKSTSDVSDRNAAELDGIDVHVIGDVTKVSDSGSVSLQRSEDGSVCSSSRSTSEHVNGHISSGKTGLSNGSVRGRSPGVTGSHAQRSLTPEPRPKFGKRLYEKNSKLTASSADHLDNMSIRSGRPSNHLHHHGARSEKGKQLTVPIAQGAEVKSIPSTGNLQEFTADQMVTIFRLLRFPEEMILKLHRNKVNGKRFSLFTDKDLEAIGMARNPVVKHFRDRSAKKVKKKFGFML